MWKYRMAHNVRDWPKFTCSEAKSKFGRAVRRTGELLLCGVRLIRLEKPLNGTFYGFTGLFELAKRYVEVPYAVQRPRLAEVYLERSEK